MNAYEDYAFEDADLFEDEDDDDDDDTEFDTDEPLGLDDDAVEDSGDFDEARLRRRSRRRAPRIRVGRTARGNRLRLKGPPSRRPASRSAVQSSLGRVGKDIRTNAAAVKRLAAQAKSATVKLNRVNNAQDKTISALRSKLRKHTAAAQQQAQMNMLMPLLEKSPELEARPGANPDVSVPLLNAVQIKKQDNTLALIMMMMASNQSSEGSSSGMNMMLPMILMLDR